MRETRHEMRKIHLIYGSMTAVPGFKLHRLLLSGTD